MQSGLIGQMLAACRGAPGALFLAVALSACGGGGGSTSTDVAVTAPPVPLVTTAPALAPTPAPAPASAPVIVVAQSDPSSWLLCPDATAVTVGQTASLSCRPQLADLTLTTQWRVLSAPSGFQPPTMDGLGVSFVTSLPGDYAFELRTTHDTASRVDILALQVQPPPNAAPVVDCPASATGQQSQPMEITCTASDDGQPAGGSLRLEWRVVSGPQTPSLGSANGPQTNFTPPLQGDYVLRLSASDGTLSTSQDIAVKVGPPPNQAPSVTCRTELTGITQQEVALNCTATDDGQPAGSSLKPRWTLLSSPAPVTLTGQDSFNAQMTAAAQGAYRFRLDVSDGQLSSQAEVVVTLSLPPNRAPTLSCPETASGQVNRTVELQCSAQDDGLPVGSSIRTTWAWVNAPATPTLSTVGGSSVQFVPTTSGSYRLRATASDSLLTDAKEIVVQVDPDASWRIQNLGASTVNGYAGQQSYRYRLWKKLLDASVSFDFVGSSTTVVGGSPSYPAYLGRPFDRDHEGHSSLTAGDVANGLPGWMGSYVPDISLVYVGANNLLQQGSSGIDSALNGLTSIVRSLRNKNPNVRILVGQLIIIDPQHPSWSLGSAPQVGTYTATLNSRIPGWAAGLSTAQSPINVVDHSAGFNARTDTIDGLHPNTSGEEKMAQRWRDALLPLLQR